MTEPGEIRLRRPVEADHARLVGQIDEWWGGRKMHPLLPRLWFQHFTGTSWVAEDETGGWSASSSGSSARIARTRPTST